MNKFRNKTTYRILIMALVLLMVPVLCGCRQRITNNTEVTNTMKDEEGWISETYQARRDELSMPTAEPPLIKGGTPDDYDYDEYYDDDADMLSDLDPGEVDEDKDKNDKDDNNKDDKKDQRQQPQRPGGGSDARNPIKGTLDANGGKCGQKFVTVRKGGTYGGLPTPQREGYDFTGWYTKAEKGKEVTSTTKVTNDKAHTIYAHWKKQDAPKVMVTFDPYAADAEFTSGEETKEVTLGGKYGTLPKVEREGYDFTGWYTEKKEGTKVTSKTEVTNKDAHTLYAHWSRQEEPEPVMHTVTFDANADDAEFTSGETMMEIEEGGTYSKLPTVVREGYTFEGWYTDPEGGDQVSGGDKFTAEEDITLFAHWNKEDPTKTWGKKFDSAVNDIAPSDATICIVDGDDVDSGEDLVESCRGRKPGEGEEAQFIVKFVKNSLFSEDPDKLTEILTETYDSLDSESSATVMLVSNKAIGGNNEQRLWYKLMLLTALHENAGDIDLNMAADDLGLEIDVDVFYPIY